MQTYEVIQYEGSDGRIYYVIFRLQNGTRQRLVCRTMNGKEAIRLLSELLSIA